METTILCNEMKYYSTRYPLIFFRQVLNKVNIERFRLSLAQVLFPPKLKKTYIFLYCCFSKAQFFLFKHENVYNLVSIENCSKGMN